MSATGSGSSSSQQGSSGGQEFVVRIPKQNKKRYHVMRFGAALNVDVSKWTQARMERENNIKEYKAEEELPKYGAGSEFGREQREESRRKKYGIAIKKYNPDDQPWQLKVHQGKNGKKYRGIREGGITENTSYYVFTQAPDGAFEASPVEEWYNFTPIQRYKHLSAEEAEEAFGKRDKVLNYFSIMLKKRLQNNDNTEEDEEEKKKKGGKNKKKSGDFKISDMDEWLTDSDPEEDEDEEPKDSDEDKSNKKDKGKKGQEKKKKKKKSQDSDEEAVEESDEGDFDTREVDYITSSSSSEEEPEEEKANREMKGVEDEEALRKLDQSEDEEEEEKDENKETNEGEEATDEKAAEAKPKHKAEKADGSSGDSSSDSSDSDFDDSKCQSAVFMQKPRKKNGSDNSASSSRANTPTKMLAQKSAQKRKADPASTSNKKAKTEGSSAGGPSASTEGITEEAVRRYLMRKPMTTTELLQKFKSKKTGLSGNQLVTTIAQILKRLNPEKQTIKQKLYLSIKPDGS